MTAIQIAKRAVVDWGAGKNLGLTIMDMKTVCIGILDLEMEVDRLTNNRAEILAMYTSLEERLNDANAIIKELKCRKK